MKIILLKPIPKLGGKDDVVEVASAYARNFLIPKGLVVGATKTALAGLEARKARVERQKDILARQNERLGKILAGQTILVRASANAEGVLFAGMGREEIAFAIEKRKKVKINPRDLELVHKLKTLGTHEVVLKLGGGEVKFFVEIAPGQGKDN